MREPMLILHFIGLTMGLGTSFAHAFLGIAAAKMPPDDVAKFRMQTMVLGRMGHVGLALLIVSGIYLLAPFWSILPSSPLLIAKLTLVVVLVLLISLIGVFTKRAQKGNAEAQLQKMEKLGKMTLIIGLTIVVLAVYIFH